MRDRFRYFCTLLFLCFFSVHNWADGGNTEKPKIAIVIDDLGYDLSAATWVAQQPFPITLAVIPGAPYSKQILSLGLERKQELILHVPMEPEYEKDWEEGLTTNMGKSELEDSLNTMLQAHPHIVGINNHGGSLLTKDGERMSWIMSQLKPRKLFFLDSRTTNKSQAEIAATSAQVEIGVRDVFLDHDIDEDKISKQFQSLRQIASKKGEAIAIGHPHPETLRALARELPQLIEEGYELTFCSKIIQNPTEMASK